MKFLRMRPGYGEQLIAEGDPALAEDEQRLVAEFRRQLEPGMWAAIPVQTENGRREAEMVRGFRRDPARRRPCDLLPARRGRGRVAPR